MKILELDDEQAAMIIIALEASNALLEARVHRVDPNGILSNSFTLQRHKIAQIALQLQGGTVARWSDLHPGAQVQATQLLEIAFTHPDAAIRGVTYDKLVNFALSQRAAPRAPAHLQARA
jgi:hypothetical protein